MSAGRAQDAFSSAGAIKAINGALVVLSMSFGDKTIGRRVSPAENAKRLAFTEHGDNAYPDVEVPADA